MLVRLTSGRVARYLAVATAGAAVGAGGLAFAASGGGVIRACANVKTGALRISAKCKKKQERAVSWNRQGPQGPRGVPGATGVGGATGAPGATGSAGASATKLFATVDLAGTIVASSPGVQVFHDATGQYEVNFGQDVSHCAAIANIGSVPVYSAPGGNTGRATGYAITDLEAAGSTLPTSGYPSADTVVVDTIAGSGDSPKDTSFDVAVFC